MYFGNLTPGMHFNTKLFPLLQNLTFQISGTLIGIQAWSSSRSLRQISRWSSPAPAMMCSPFDSLMHCTIGSDLASLLRPSTNLGSSWGFLGSTATRTTGDTENFICFMLCASLQDSLVIVPVLMMY